MGLFSTTDASVSSVTLPILQPRWIKVVGTIPGGDEADQTVQETKRHQASSEIVRSENLAADVVSMTQEIKSPPGQFGTAATLNYLLDLMRAEAMNERR
jgi:hypothetical protein